MFYASWSPYISEATIPVLKEVVNFYKSKMNFTYVNLDDTKDQFVKSSNAMLKGLPGNNVYGEGGLNSQIAKDLGIYGFKPVSYTHLDVYKRQSLHWLRSMRCNLQKWFCNVICRCKNFSVRPTSSR